MTLVIDCNILVSCLSSKSRYYIIYQHLVRGSFALAISTEIMLEYEEVIQNKYGLSTANSLISLLKELPNVYQHISYYKWKLIEADPDDDKYVDCAISGRADYLVTEDKHFAVLKTVSFPSVKTISIDDLVVLLHRMK